MSSVQNPTFSLGKLMPQQRDAMQKLLESQTFASTPRLREVLTHLFHALEEGIGDQVTEQSIGQIVFGKPAGYNASEDNIVRVTIRHLRNRLEEYYRSEGKDDALVLVIPKGKYIPAFVPRESASSHPMPTRMSGETEPSSQPSVPHIGDTAPGNSTDTPQPVTSTRARWLWLTTCAAILVSFITGFAVRSTIRPVSKAGGGVLGLLCRPGDNVTVVVVDSNLQAYRQIFEKQVSLNDYIQRKYAKDAIDSVDPRVTNAQRFSTGTNETNVSSAIIAASVRQALEGRRVVIKHPHDVSMREFQEQEDVILLGGPWINPWGQLFEGHLNFRLLPLPKEPSSSQVHNYSPRPGEAVDYIPHMDGNLNVNYVRIAILPNFERAGRVILIGATSAEALEAAGGYLLSDEAIRELLDKFHVGSVAELPPLEFLLEVRGLNSVPGSHRIVAERTVQQ
jgi:hypothetical protein